ncbi:MAG: hypothetical protein N2491_09800 [Negativicutes bacterium]|nr:hypothetical protein [Negativicutes bacterium]
MSFWQREWKFVLIMLLICIVTGVAYYEYRQHAAAAKNPAAAAPPSITINTSGQPSQAGEPQVVYVKGDNTHTREIVYVPKEVDPQTGKTEKTDVQFERRENKIYVLVNGKEFAVPAEVKEDAKFEKGKLVITEKAEMRVNITAPKPSFNLGVGWSNNGPAAQMSGPLIKNASWWLYGDKNTVAGGVQFPIMK